jgi:hypothetical protein
MSKTIVYLGVIFKNLITNKEDDILSFYREIPPAENVAPGDNILIEVGDGENTIFGRGRCIYQFKVERIRRLSNLRIIILKESTFSNNFKEEFLKNWQEPKEGRLPTAQPQI